MRNILFDVDGVLIHGFHTQPELQHRWSQNLHNDFGIPEDLFTQEFIQGPFINEVLIGQKSLYAALRKTLPELGYGGSTQEFIDYWLKNDSKMNYDLQQKIQTLKNSGNFRMFIATNQEHERARYLMDDLCFNRYFEDIFYSARIGYLKPEQDYYDFINKTLPESKFPPIFFDDSPHNVDVARANGWDAYIYNSNDDLQSCMAIRRYL
mgnify:CR=1 FL=1